MLTLEQEYRLLQLAETYQRRYAKTKNYKWEILAGKVLSHWYRQKYNEREPL